MWLFSKNTTHILIHRNRLKIVCTILTAVLAIIASIVFIRYMDAIKEANNAIEIEIEEETEIDKEIDPYVAIQLQRQANNALWDTMTDKTMNYFTNNGLFIQKITTYDCDQIIYYALLDDAKTQIKQNKDYYNQLAQVVYNNWWEHGFQLNVIIDISDTENPDLTLYQSTNGESSFENY